MESYCRLLCLETRKTTTMKIIKRNGKIKAICFPWSEVSISSEVSCEGLLLLPLGWWVVVFLNNFGHAAAHIFCHERLLRNFISNDTLFRPDKGVYKLCIDYYGDGNILPSARPQGQPQQREKTSSVHNTHTWQQSGIHPYIQYIQTYNTYRQIYIHTIFTDI